MKDFKAIYKLPLRKAKYGTWVWCNDNNFVLQFEPKYKNGEYADGWVDFETKVLNKINGSHEEFEHEFTLKNGYIYYNGTHVMTIRGWGNLTSAGAHNLPPEEAENIQDTFAEFLIKQLNKILV